MASLHTPTGAIHLLQIFGSSFLAILFLQSGIDKLIDYRNNLEWLKGHFAKSPLGGVVPILLKAITLLEVTAGALSAIGCIMLIVSRESTVAFYCAVLRTTNGKGIRWGSRACSLLLADAGHNLSARAELSSCLVRSCRSNTLFYFSLLTDHVSPIPPSYFLPIFGGKSQRSFPSSDSGSTSTSATPALESLSDAPVNPKITLVKSGSWPTSISTFARCRFTTIRNLLLPNPGASDSSLRTFALR